MGATSCQNVTPSFGGWFDSPEMYATYVGQKRTVFLEDGTKVHLNTASRIAVRFTGHARVLELVQGDVIVDVGKDRRPFRIVSGPALFRDIGTRFVLSRNAERIQLVVIEGRVSVEPASHRRNGVPIAGEGRQVIGAHESVQISSTRYQPLGPKRKLSRGDVNASVAWQSDHLVFRGETLAEAVAQVNRFNRRQIEITDATVANRRIGGSLRTTDAQEFVRVIEEIGLAKVHADEAEPSELIRLGDPDQ